MKNRILILAGTAMGLVLAGSQTSATALADARIMHSLDHDARLRVEPAVPPMILAQAETEDELDEEELRRRLEEEAEAEAEEAEEQPEEVEEEPEPEDDDEDDASEPEAEILDETDDELIEDEPPVDEEEDILDDEAPAEQEDILEDVPEPDVEITDEADDELQEAPPVEEEEDILDEPELPEDEIEDLPQDDELMEEEDILEEAPEPDAEILDESDEEAIEDDQPLEEEIIEQLEEPVDETEEEEPAVPEDDEVEDIPEEVPAEEEEEEILDDVTEPQAETLEEPVDEAIEEELPAEIDEEEIDEEVLEEADPPVEEEEPVEEAVDPEEREDAAPLLDSEKEAEQLGLTGDDLPAEEEDDVPPPETDADAQAEAQPVEIESMRAEEGRRFERREEVRTERREGAEVVREIGDRIVIQFNNQLIVQGREDPRMGRDATEVYYEELPRGRTRETVIRPNGVTVVTIRDRYGDVIRRSRILPDGTEFVLVYADDRGRDGDGRRQWRDPARELPPLRLRIPVEEYILEARLIEEWDDWEPYYRFLDRPPVERVQRLYTIDEVRYSSRVRDMMPRIELDTLTFDFGSAAISEGEIGRLQGVAEAMHRMLDDNPAEMFLIEGHTDAVGTHEANLALSDRRAETVAMALTDFFDIPPENMVTQGYGKNYLKINTQAPERLNRRVVVRRITPLVTPVAAR